MFHVHVCVPTLPKCCHAAIIVDLNSKHSFVDSHTHYLFLKQPSLQFASGSLLFEDRLNVRVGEANVDQFWILKQLKGETCYESVQKNYATFSVCSAEF